MSYNESYTVTIPEKPNLDVVDSNVVNQAVTSTSHSKSLTKVDHTTKTTTTMKRFVCISLHITQLGQKLYENVVDFSNPYDLIKCESETAPKAKHHKAIQD